MQGTILASHLLSSQVVFIYLLRLPSGDNSRSTKTFMFGIIYHRKPKDLRIGSCCPGGFSSTFTAWMFAIRVCVSTDGELKLHGLFKSQKPRYGEKTC